MKRSEIRIIKSKIINLFILGIVVLGVIIAYKLYPTSKSEKIVVTDVDYIDSITKEEIIISVNADNNEDGYFFELPKNINGLEVEKYYVEDNGIRVDEITDEEKTEDEIQKNVEDIGIDEIKGENEEKNELEQTSSEEDTTVANTLDITVNNTVDEGQIIDEEIDKEKQDNEIENLDELEKNDENDVEELDSIEKDKEEENKLEKGEEKQTENQEEDKVEKHEENQDDKEECLTDDKEEKVWLKPGSKYYLSEEEMDSEQVTFKVVYKVRESNSKTLYYKVLETKLENNNIKIEGYMPKDADINIKVADFKEVEDIIKEEDEFLNLNIAYDIKILSDGRKYEPNDFDENVKVTVTGIVDQENTVGLKVIHIDDNEKVEELKTVSIDEEDLSFSTKSFSVFAIVSPSVNPTQSGTIWNGSIANSFAWGSGTEDNPYLIANGEELAYLRAQVNSGRTFDGEYFKLVDDINLNNNVWIPIGTAQTYFGGIFDGQGFTISNGVINANGTNAQMYAYGIFGSLEGSDEHTATVCNTVFDNIQINITFPSNNLNSDFGYKVGIVAGAMYRYTAIENVIVRNSRISNNTWTTVMNGARPSVFVGGIVGEAAYSSTNSLTQVTEGKYIIDNCFSDVDINIEISSNEIAGASRLLIGGIIGRISWHTAWPTSCLYTGTMGGGGSTMMMGPIFGGETSRDYDIVDNFNNLALIWEGDPNLTMTSYYTDYTVKGTRFTSTFTNGDTPNDTQYRQEQWPNWYGHVAGVNKGIYTTDLSSSMLNMFNENAEEGNFASWTYEGGTFDLNPGLEITVTETQDELYKFKITPNSKLSNPTYIYKWYINNILDEANTTNNASFEPSFSNSRKIQVLVSDGVNVSLAQFTLEKLTLDLIINEKNGDLVPEFIGTGAEIAQISEYDVNWYKVDIIEGKTGESISTDVNLSNPEREYEYEVEFTNGYEGAEVLSAKYDYTTRNIVYVNNTNYTINGVTYVGNDNNSGATPESAVSTLTKAYQLMDSNGTIDSNIIVVMGNYNNTDFLDVRGGNEDSYNEARNRFNKKALVTGKCRGELYNANLNFSCMDNAYNGKYLFADTRIEYITFNGNNGRTFLYMQGNNLIMGSGIEMVNYENIDNSDFGQIKGLQSPNFSMFCGFHNYSQTSIPAEAKECELLIRSGTYGRVITGGRNNADAYGLVQNSHNIFGSLNDYFKATITVDFINQTSGTTPNINLLVGGATDSNIYAHSTINVKSGKIARILGGNIGSNTITFSGYPVNLFVGSTTLNISGGDISEIYGTSLGRWTDIIYYYGKVEINISGGIIRNAIYGAGAASITGHNPTYAYEYYSSYASGVDTSVEVNVSGGEILGNIYGGGYGYSSYLNQDVRNDGGALYGDSTINITGGTISGEIYGAGRGYEYRNKTNLAQMIGDSEINISGNPTITGTIYGAGEGIADSDGIAKLIGNSSINVKADIDANIYGGGSIVDIQGSTNVTIDSGTSTGIIYGGGNRGDVLGDSSVTVNGGNLANVYGGGNESTVLNARVTCNGGTVENLYGGGNLSYAIEGEVVINDGNISNVYGGGNESGADSSVVYVKGGTIGRIFGGSNNSGEIGRTTVTIENGTIFETYGGNNEGGMTKDATVIIYGGDLENVYGGGNNVDTHITNVYLRNSTEKIGNVYGGGNNAGAYQSNVYAEGGEAENVYGGSNNSGTVTQSTVYIGDDGDDSNDEIKSTYDGSYDFYIEEESEDVEPQEGYVAYMNGTYYEKLQQAIDAAGNTETKIVMIDNTKEAINIPAGKNIKLDLNSKTLTSDDTTITLRGKLTVTDTSIKTLGKIETTGPTNAYYPILQYGGELVFNKGTLESKYRGLRTYDNARVIINGGNLSANGGSGIGFESDGYFEMNGGIVFGNSHGFYTSHQVQITITGGKISGNSNAVFNSGGTSMTIGKHDGQVSQLPLITGGQTGINSQNARINFYDGIIRGTNTAINGNIGNIEDGTSVQNTTQVVEAKNFKIVSLTGAMRMFAMRSTVLAASGPVSMNGTYYNSLREAINAAGTEEATIKLYENRNEDIVIESNRNIKLDLNGYTLRVNNTIRINGGKLIVTDTSENKTGRVEGNGSTLFTQYGGELIIKKGTFVANNRGITANQNARTIIEGGNITANSGSAITFEGTGYFEMTGGKVHGNSNGFYTEANVQIIITGGEISGNTNGVYNNGTTAIIIGKKDGIVRKTPIISGGQTGLRHSATVINFYDGVLRGTNSAMTGSFADLEKSSVTKESTQNINGTNYRVVELFGSSLPDIEVTLPTADSIKIDNIYGGNNLGGSTTVSNIFTHKYSGIVKNIFGGGNRVDATTTNIQINDGEITNIHGGSNESGDVNKANIVIQGGKTKNLYGGNNKGGTTNTANVNVKKGTVTNVYGGNNLGGTTINAKVQTNGGEVTNVYGGGNQAATNVTNLTVRSNILGNVYGGGNQAPVNTNTNVVLSKAVVSTNVYGGGNEGVVVGNTYLTVTDSEIAGSVYAGGNGTTAIVLGNANVVLEGHTVVEKHVFGGGNQAATGTEGTNSSISTVNIAGANINGNVYGGANTSVVYGVTRVNIGNCISNIDELKKASINISGTVFGGGEANEAGDENYDFSFISVTNGTEININPDTYNEFSIGKSIFGSGNASTTTGTSIINISNYGTREKPCRNVSIQRASLVVLDNCAIWLEGATDRTNEHSNILFSLSRIDELKMKNDTCLYLENGANLLKKLSSIAQTDGGEQKGEAKINEDGSVTKNVDNRIYIREGVNLNVAENEQANEYGDVYGMFFLGLYTGKNHISTGIYSEEYKHGDEVNLSDKLIFTRNSYVLGEHYENHDITVDGFYSNFKDENDIISVNYITPTPENQIYYIWHIGELTDAVIYEIDLTASKYNTLGTKELQLLGFSKPNTVFEYTGSSYDLVEGINLVDKKDINNIESNQEIADSNFGLGIETSRIGWGMEGKTNFMSGEPYYNGTTTYLSENSTVTPTLNFYLYHSQNISIEQELGEVVITFTAIEQIDDLNKNIRNILIYVKMDTAFYQDSYYEAAISPGEKYELFTNTRTNITSKSEFSQYYSLLIHDFSDTDYYDEYLSRHRTLVSSTVLPANTTITMIDIMVNATEYYYYTVTEEDVAKNKKEYNISEFKQMGSTDKLFDEDNTKYYSSELDIEHEEFIFHFDFSNTGITEPIKNENILLEYRDDDDQTLIGVLGDIRETLDYSVYIAGSNISVEAEMNNSSVYLGKDLCLNVTTDYNQTIIDNKIIYDTNYFGNKLGIKITFFDSKGEQVIGSSLLGVHFELNGNKYYPRTDGTTRINIAENVSNVASKIKVITDNSNLASGVYRIKVEAFSSPDGIYYGLESADETIIPLYILSSIYGLKINLEDSMVIINSETGMTQNDNNELNFNIEYSSGVVSPNIRVGLYRRTYEGVYSNSYNLVDLQDYVTNELTTTNINDMYLVTDNPTEEFNFEVNLKEELVTGTYKVVFAIYDGDIYIGEMHQYIIIN